jgi:hypothetical protein
MCAGWLRRSMFAGSWESFPPRQDAEHFQNSYIFLDLAPIFLQITDNYNTSNFYLYLETGLWIRIHFLRIRIRIRIQWIRMEANTDPDPDPIRIQGFNDQKLKKNYS